ncbi:right-handed parallel beta-helix repeat-containing protein [Dyella sp. 2HG41-7]|uniref:right-handed parallel beta-helix repeat-containing protein n=1 Tax=Dyella sp. 2HG41-7 TaxID=2883239 RepID=UPI001F2E3179|nr:right-handed parallel beta-helix repeat-containing protein [Dyella sp. 2HG41-7]
MKSNSSFDLVSSERRNFLRCSLWALPPIALSAWALPRTTWGWQSTSGPVINVRDKGAKGDGTTDDTSAFKAAIEALPSSGGTVSVPPGNYIIDAMRAINLRSNMLFQLAPTATLTAIPNNSPRSHVIKVWNCTNVRITGGRIVGERNAHSGVGGEWGYGLNIQASNHVYVSNMHISDCWGDGIWIGAIGPDHNATPSTDVTIDNVISINNRRQGLSIGPVDGVVIKNSTFSGSNGTKPESGIDIEPQAQGFARNITIDTCTISNNHGTGMEIHYNVSGVTIKNCTFQGNAGYGLMTADNPSQLTITNNTFTGNGLVGLTIAGQTSHVQATGNTLTGNSTRYVHNAAKALTSSSSGNPAQHKTDLRVDPGTSDVNLSNNKF